MVTNSFIVVSGKKSKSFSDFDLGLIMKNVQQYLFQDILVYYCHVHRHTEALNDRQTDTHGILYSCDDDIASIPRSVYGCSY